jgi:CHAD domain-containing protein
MKKKIEKRLAKINAFLKSKKVLSLDDIHLLRLEVKHLEAYSELISVQNNFGAGNMVPKRLEELFHESGNVRKYALETKAILSITDNNKLSKPTRFLRLLRFSKKKSRKELSEKRMFSGTFKPDDFAKHPDAELSFLTWQKFLEGCASSILDLLNREILSDIKRLHELRKIFKSILYVSPLFKSDTEQLVVFLKAKKEYIKSIESKIGSLHDTDFFLRWMAKKKDKIHGSEESTLNKIKQVWQNDMKNMTDDFRPLLAAVRQFALDLKENTTSDLQAAEQSSSVLHFKNY